MAGGAALRRGDVIVNGSAGSHGGRRVPAVRLERFRRYNHHHMRIAIGADHAGFALKEHLVDDARRGSGHDGRRRGTDSDAPVDYPPICARRRARGRRRARRSRHRHRRQRPGRADRRQQGRRRPRRALQRSLHRPAVARSTTTPTSSRSAPASSAPGWPTRSSPLWLDTPFEGGRHQRRIDQIAEIERQQHAPVNAGR